MKIILGLVIMLFVALFVSCLAQSFERMNNSDIKAIVSLTKEDKATVVDVRTRAEYETGHIENSINIPLDEIESSLDKFKEFDQIVVVCRSGGRSAKAKQTLENHGFTDIYNGMGWENLNKVLTKD